MRVGLMVGNLDSVAQGPSLSPIALVGGKHTPNISHKRWDLNFSPHIDAVGSPTESGVVWQGNTSCRR